MIIKIIDKKCEGQRIVEILKNDEKIQALEISSYAEAAIDIEVIQMLLEDVYNAGRNNEFFSVIV